MKPKVYIETSIPSFYFETRTNAAAVARREWTEEWWEVEREQYEIVTSIAVIDELRATPSPKREQCLLLMSDIPLLSITEEVIEIAEVYISQKVMPSNPTGDALHLALASWHKCDYLLTWNCKHIANANKAGHVKRINTKLDLHVPQLYTPLQLIGDQNNDTET
jgi:2-phospho-L-lactate guanylyltransferase (CobY/MobA/RfbA family)